MTPTGTLALILNLLTTMTGSVLGAIVGGDSHPVAGALIGSTIGYMAPSLLAHWLGMHTRLGKLFRTTRHSVAAVLAAVATNEWVTDANREMVQSIRGIAVASMMGAICGTLIAWAAAGATVLPIMVGAASGFALAALLTTFFELWS
jgi:hypothetical protein